MSLFSTKEAAYAAPGSVFQHFKGGVYRVLKVRDDGVVEYEHLWPHPHSIHERPIEEFRDSVDRPEYSGLRFVLVNGDPI